MIENGGVASSAEKTMNENPTIIRIEVEDFEESVRELQGRGVSVDVHHYDWGTVGAIIDPEGNRIEIKRYH